MKLNCGVLAVGPGPFMGYKTGVLSATCELVQVAQWVSFVVALLV